MNNTTSLPNGLQRFVFYLQQIQKILSDAAGQQNPALYFYQQNARTPLFMLEALSRVYRNLHNKKKFIKLQERFKQLEDMLGAVDYYDGFYKEFTAKNNVPAAIISFLQKKRDENLQLLNDKLTNDKWAGEESKRIAKINKQLGKMNWMNEAEETNTIREFYKKAVGSINKDISENKINFEDVEADVHELRRELRWLSIYPQCLRGLIQLSETKDSPEFLNKYLTDEIKNSSFNKMPDGRLLQNHILLSQNYFYALSWLIAALGKLKDTGLRILVITEALMEINKQSRKQAEKDAVGLCGEGQLSLEEILLQAKQISETFFYEKVLDKLVVQN